MREVEKLIEALQIFAKYPDADGWLSAEHDEVWFGPDPSIVSDVDKARLNELGWHPDFDGESTFHKFT